MEQDQQDEQEAREDKAKQKSMERELNWIRAGAKARQAKSKARINAYNEMASKSERELLSDISASAGTDASWLDLGAIEQQHLAIIEDVHRVRSHPLIGARARVGGFLYDVDTGLMQQIA